jgi:hypothetical protein
VVHYVDHQDVEIPIIYGSDVSNWLPDSSDSKGAPDSARIAWGNQEQVTLTQKEKPRIRLYKSSWKNPVPDDEVSSIDFAASHPETRPFLVAITAE